MLTLSTGPQNWDYPMAPLERSSSPSVTDGKDSNGLLIKWNRWRSTKSLASPIANPSGWKGYSEIAITLRFHLPQVRMAAIKKRNDNRCWQAWKHSWMECELATMEINMEAPQETKPRTTTCSRHTTLGICLRESTSSAEVAAYPCRLYTRYSIQDLEPMQKLWWMKGQRECGVLYRCYEEY